MCIITAEEQEAIQHRLSISKTNIFAHHTRPCFQAVVYSMSIASSTRTAMILPVPVVVGSGEDALRFIDLSGYANFFDDLRRACKPEYEPPPLDDWDADTFFSAETLVVHEVGDYEASYVPAMSYFNRLDPRFRLPEEIWKKMPDYSDYGFAVFQLKITLSASGSETENTVHPMAFEFPTRNCEKLFYPTVHVHDGDYHSKAGFNHMLYCQRDNARSEFKYQTDLFHNLPPTTAVTMVDGLPTFYGYNWFYRSDDVASESMRIDKCEGVIEPNKKIYAMFLSGNYSNCDIWLGDSA